MGEVRGIRVPNPQLLSDSHSPGLYRAFVPVTNIDAWYQVFNVQPGDKLYRAPADRVKIW